MVSSPLTDDYHPRQNLLLPSLSQPSTTFWRSRQDPRETFHSSSRKHQRFKINHPPGTPTRNTHSPTTITTTTATTTTTTTTAPRTHRFEHKPQLSQQLTQRQDQVARPPRPRPCPPPACALAPLCTKHKTTHPLNQHSLRTNYSLPPIHTPRSINREHNITHKLLLTCIAPAIASSLLFNPPAILYTSAAGPKSLPKTTF